jgi:hypothetical protein
MICDIHVHVCGATSPVSGNYLSDKLSGRWLFRSWSKRMGLTEADWRDGRAGQTVERRLAGWIAASGLDRAVVLALDGVYREDGTYSPERTLLKVDNDYVADIAAKNEKLMFGASVHPYRRDALAELSRLAARGACLVKWLPSAQNINPGDPRCIPFYDWLAARRMPLLCHTGAEHALRNFPAELNDPARLVPALERGVTVIAAHCGTRMMLHQKSYFRQWRELALRHENLYGDISAFAFPVRAQTLLRLLKNPALTAKLVFGSDFPAPAMPLAFLGKLDWETVGRLRGIANPFDRAVAVFRAIGVPEAVFSRAEKLLRLPLTLNPEQVSV